jgi:hypothetical protein
MSEDQFDAHAVCYLCSILDEKTKAERSIIYDSPAATKKVLDLCNALRIRIRHVYVVTMARGRQQGKRRSFAASIKRISSTPVLCARFSSMPVLTYLISSMSMACLVWMVIWRLRDKQLHLIVYNRSWLYIPALVISRLFGTKCYLDLEDGALVETSGIRGRARYVVTKQLFNMLCRDGSIVVSPPLLAQVGTNNNVVCYGIAERHGNVVRNDWRGVSVRFLLGGTLVCETGALLLMDAVRILEVSHKEYKGTINILVTGHGPLAIDIAKFAQSEGKGWVDYLGRVTKIEYEKCLASSHVGLCLKLPSSEMGTTTFPSKVIEISSYGKLVLTTRLEHVVDLFGADGACYMNDESAESLARAMLDVVSDRDGAMKAARAGQKRILALCGAERVVDSIGNLFGINVTRENS